MKHDDMTPVVQGILIVLIAVIIFMMFILVSGQSQASENEYRYRKIGIQAYAFEWLDSLPYQHIQPMQWTNELGFYEIVYPDYRLYSIVDLETGYVTEVHIDDNGNCFAFTFMEARGADGHPHPNGGFWWVTCDE